MHFAVVIPAYNNEHTIPDVLQRVKKIVSEDNIIVVNDGSHDQTVKLCESAGVHLFSFSHNQGKGAALKLGFLKVLESDYEAVITLDADGQHPPELIPNFMAYFEKYSGDIIIGSRMGALKNMPFSRILSNKITSWLISQRIHQQVADSQCGFRLIRRTVLENLQLNLNKFDFESEIIIKAGLAGYQICSVPIETIYHDYGSSINHVTDTLRFIKLFWKSLFWAGKAQKENIII
ncbi:glycosyltransferase family 2 protein [candidate division KSB1 bacterium]|nr:glycosyltransferase family 2 protein [candidate division KSB1 bacterium]